MNEKQKESWNLADEQSTVLFQTSNYLKYLKYVLEKYADTNGLKEKHVDTEQGYAYLLLYKDSKMTYELCTELICHALNYIKTVEDDV